MFVPDQVLTYSKGIYTKDMLRALFMRILGNDGNNNWEMSIGDEFILEENKAKTRLVIIKSHD